MYEYAALKLNLIRDSLKLSTYLYNVLCLYIVYMQVYRCILVRWPQYVSFLDISPINIIV